MTAASSLDQAKRPYQVCRHALGGVRGRKPVDYHLLEQILVRFSQLVTEQPRIREIEINPLLVGFEGSGAPW